MFDGIAPLSSVNEPTFAKARAFVECCTSLLDANGQLPASRFELRQLLKVAPCVVIAGVIDGGADFEIRLAGTRVVAEFFGRDPTGARLSQLVADDEFGKRSWFILREVLRSKRPVLNQPGRTRLKSKEFMRLETVNYPLVDDSGKVVKIACLYDYFFEKESVAAG